MATVKQGEKDYLEEHSKEKVAFYKKYLDLYLTVLINAKNTKAINIYDIFCGVGIYDEDGSKGSPIAAMESIRYQLKKFGKNKSIQVTLAINDGDEDKVKIAKKYIEKYYDNGFIFNAHNLQSQDIISLVIEKIRATEGKESNLIFIDPHGYKDIYQKDILNIMEAGKSEILIFLPIHNMYRFSKGAMTISSNPSDSNPLKRFIKEFKLNYDAESTKEYIRYVQNSLSFDNQYYTASYRLRATNSNNDYALFFITKNLKGLEKAIETKWKLDKLCGEGFEKKKVLSLFNEEDEGNKKEDCLSVLGEKLRQYLCKERTNNELYKFTIINGFLLKHCNAILKQLQKNNELIFSNDIRIRKTFYLSYSYHKNEEVKYLVKINE